MGSPALRHVGSFQTWDQTHAPGPAGKCLLLLFKENANACGATELLRPRGAGWGDATPAPAHAPASAGRYGQMTAGSYCYIGPQGIVHGTVVSGGPRGRGTGGLSKRGW